MKLGEHARKGARKDKAAELMKPREEKKFSFREVFTPAEWQEIESDVFRTNKNFGYVQDRYFLFAVSDDPRHQIESDEELFSIGVEWVNDILHGFDNRGIGFMNQNQALHCLGILSKAFPEKRKNFLDRDAIKSFVHDRGRSFFKIDRQHPKAVGLRILLRTITDYLATFPEDRAWVFENMAEQNIEQKIRPALEAEIAANNWGEILHLSAAARLLFPHIPMTHQENITDYFKGQKRSHARILYTLLPDLMDLRVVLADEAELGQDGEIHIVDHSPSMMNPQSLPDRLVA